MELVKWRGLELPYQVKKDEETLSASYGKFTIEPFERGFGTTIGNSLRRVLLSSIEGAAVTSVKIAGATHEFSSIEGVVEDVTEIILRVKNMAVKLDADGPQKLRLRAQGPGAVTADLIEMDPSVSLVNPDLEIANTTKPILFDMELTVEKGRGYIPATERYENGRPLDVGEIAVDAIFSPVTRVRYRVEDTRVGQKTNYDRLVLEIWTDGTVDPEIALVESGKILRKHLNPLVHYFELGEEVAASAEEVQEASPVNDELLMKLRAPITDLGLSQRPANCLENHGCVTIADVVSMTEEDVMAIRSFGETSMVEVRESLANMGLSLGMSVPAELITRR